MSKIHFSNGNRHPESRHYWRWRQLRDEMRTNSSSDQQLHREFCQQAQQVREQLCFLLNGSSGSEDSLSALAEEDMTNFCVMVDLAQGIALDDVAPLPADIRNQVLRFLATEPWRSLAVDNEISVALALLDSLGIAPSDTPLGQQPPGLLNVVESVLQNVNTEQYNRFLQEYQRLTQRDQLGLPNELSSVFEAMVRQAADRLGIRPPVESFWRAG